MMKRARTTRSGKFTGGVAECSPCGYRVSSTALTPPLQARILTISDKEGLGREQPEPNHVQGTLCVGQTPAPRWRTPRIRAGCLPDSSNCWCLRAQRTDARNSTAPSRVVMTAVAFLAVLSPCATTARCAAAGRFAGPRRYAAIRPRQASQGGATRWFACRERRWEPYRPPFVRWAER